MSYKMYLDDIRIPPENKRTYAVVRSASSAYKLMTDLGCPKTISFDHDLGEGDTGHDVAKWIVEQDLNHNGVFIPFDFTFHVHSANPIGKINIETYLTNYLSGKEWPRYDFK